MRRALIAAALALGLHGPAAAQEPPDLSLGRVQSPVLTIDVDRMIAGTRYGRRLDADIAARGERLAAENARIAAELEAEEQALTERRPGMDADAFRAAADAFDARVQAIRAEQDGKERELQAAVVEARDVFRDAVTPVLAQVMVDSGAAVILDQRDVFQWVTAVDVTDEAIAAIDRALGEGPAAEAPGADPGAPGAPPATEPEPAPAPDGG